MARKKTWKPWTEDQILMFAEGKTDAQIAKATGRRKGAVGAFRRKHEAPEEAKSNSPLLQQAAKVVENHKKAGKIPKESKVEKFEISLKTVLKNHFNITLGTAADITVDTTKYGGVDVQTKEIGQVTITLTKR